MEPLVTYPLKCSIPKARMFVVFLSMVLCTAILCILQLKLFKPQPKDFYSFELMDLRGKMVSLGKFKGKASLVVNVASYCQHADRNYRALQELYREYGPNHFTVLAFPCNQYGQLEPDSERQIEAFVKGKYAVSFPVFKKIKILGPKAEPAFRFLIDSTKVQPKWNFFKYLVGPDGKVLKYWKPEEPIENIRKEVAAIVGQLILKKREEL
ncbi:probable glutathione peroxidase 8 [Protopterus annectens]|uniref:probable glutathione peroxidase 8 n=1 Tax=Protopterus annectens TaxID=7888 RepID=UPI001CFACE00|nr:probable glutathione peroxidase 8 [Protopterus annectens]